MDTLITAMEMGVASEGVQEAPELVFGLRQQQILV
jgi:hypothetical protein